MTLCSGPNSAGLDLGRQGKSSYASPVAKAPQAMILPARPAALARTCTICQRVSTEATGQGRPWRLDSQIPDGTVRMPSVNQFAHGIRSGQVAGDLASASAYTTPLGWRSSQDLPATVLKSPDAAATEPSGPVLVGVARIAACTPFGDHVETQGALSRPTDFTRICAGVATPATDSRQEWARRDAEHGGDQQ